MLCSAADCEGNNLNAKSLTQRPPSLCPTANMKMECNNKEMKIRKAADMNGSKTWEDLDGNLLRQIFELLEPEYLFFPASLVCPLWRSACWDVLFCKDHSTLDLSNLIWQPHYLHSDLSLQGHDLSLLATLKSIMGDQAVEDHCRCVKRITFHFLAINDEHLIFVAKRSYELKSLTVLATKRITRGGFLEAIRNWREMEEIFIGPLYNVGGDNIIQDMGICCKKLNTLHIYCAFLLDEYSSSTIAKNLQGLEVLSLDNSLINRNGVMTILDKCKHLSKLNISRCKRVINRPLSFIPGRISVRIIKDRECKCTKWSVDTQEGQHTLAEVVHHLWSDL